MGLKVIHLVKSAPGALNNLMTWWDKKKIQALACLTLTQLSVNILESPLRLLLFLMIRCPQIKFNCTRSSNEWKWLMPKVGYQCNIHVKAPRKQALLLNELYLDEKPMLSLLLNELYLDEKPMLSLLLNELYLDEKPMLSLLLNKLYLDEKPEKPMLSLLMNELYLDEKPMLSLLLNELYLDEKPMLSLLLNELYLDEKPMLYIVVQCKFPQLLCHWKHILGTSKQRTIPPGPCLNIKTVFLGMRIPMLKIRWSRDRLIFNIGIPILVKQYLYIETTPEPYQWHCQQSIVHSIIHQNMIYALPLLLCRRILFYLPAKEKNTSSSTYDNLLQDDTIINCKEYDDKT